MSSSDKYFSDLEKWLNDAYMWQGVAASFPYFLMCNQYISQISLSNANHGYLPNPLINDQSIFANAGLQQQHNTVNGMTFLPYFQSKNQATANKFSSVGQARTVLD